MIDTNLAQYDAIEDLKLDLSEAHRALGRRAGMGPDGLRSKHMSALARLFSGYNAVRVVECINKFEEHVFNGRVPHWYYWLIVAVHLPAPIKPGGVAPREAPDVRPLALGCSRLRALEEYVAELHKVVFREVLEPVQIAVGVERGGHSLVVGMRMLMEMNPCFVICKVDKADAHNEIKRTTSTRRLLEIDHLRAYGRFGLLTHAPKSLVIIDGEIANFRPEEGEHQGSPRSSGSYAAATHAEYVGLDAELKESGGSARAQVDNL